jgi:hypothetical protein
MAEKKTVFEMAKDYYPKLWSADRINALYSAGKLTEEEYKEILGENNK